MNNNHCHLHETQIRTMRYYMLYNMCQRQWFRSVPERGERRGILTTDHVASHFKQQFII